MGRRFTRLFFALAAFLLAACSEQFTGTLFKSPYPHQRYLAQLSHAGLEQSMLYKQWLEAASRSLADPTTISIPHQESAYIARTQPSAIGFSFDAREGEQLQVDLAIQSLDQAQVFIDLFSASTDTAMDHRHVASADTGVTTLSWDVRRDGRYILRVQPELLAELSFRLRITAEPSLANPVVPQAKQHIGSVFGDARDGGKRRHEGIDIFAARHTPVVAAANGRISRVGDNRLGGKVVWMRPNNGWVTLYYAHLDSQLVVPGQVVKTGDTLGLMGNTGNARTTPPHLHFGIYGAQGAVDPLPFVRPEKSIPPPIAADTSRVGDTLRVAAQLGRATPRYAPAVVEAAYDKGYRVILPDNSKHFVAAKHLAPLVSIRPMRLARPRVLYAKPDTSAARITELPAGENTEVVAEFADFLRVEWPLAGWITR